MKKVPVILTAISLLFAGFITAQEVKTISLKKAEKTGLETSQLKSNSLHVKSSVSLLEFCSKNSEKGIFEELTAKGFVKIFEAGSPNIPVISKLIEIPVGASAKVNVVSYDEEIIVLGDYGIYNKIMPAQPSVFKSDQEKQKFHYNEKIYASNNFIKKEIASVEDRGMMRNKRLGRLEIAPFQYNPVTNTLRVLNNLVIEVVFTEGASTGKAAKKKLSSPYFDALSKSTINYTKETKELLGATEIKYVIVADPMFKSALQPLVQWKTKKGFIVVEAYTDEPGVGSTTTSIRAYLKDLYDNPLDGVSPTFVLLVGDVDQVPAFPGTIPGEDHVTDLYYADYTNDNLPDVFYGRFSANTVAQLQPQIDKTLEVEHLQMPDTSYLDEVLLVAGVDIIYAPTNGNGQINYANQYYTNASNGIHSNYYLYNDDSGGMASEDPGASASIRNKVSEGVAFANYTAHCSYDGWADPSFSISNISGLTNEHKYPFMIGNCCQSAKFELNSFGEEIMRAENKGASGYIGASDYSLWDEDYWWAIGLTSIISANPTYEESGLGVYDRAFHLNGESKSDWYVTQGQILVAGNLAVEESTSAWKKYYWEMYHLMGDPSLTPFISVPEGMAVTHPDKVKVGDITFTVTCEEDAYVALSLNEKFLASGLANASGIANLSFDSIPEEGVLDIVITKQDRIPYVGQIPAIMPDVPYITFDSLSINDPSGNNNGEADFDENITLDVTLKNISDTLAGLNVLAKISTDDLYITITDSLEDYGTIDKNSVSSISDAFALTVKNNVPDQHTVNIDILITGKDIHDSSYTWYSEFNFTVNAPEFNIGDLIVDDSESGNDNGYIDPGETADLLLVINNSGHAAIDNVQGILSVISGADSLLLNNDTSILGELGAGITDTLVFNVTASKKVPYGVAIILNFEVTGEVAEYTATAEKELIIGLVYDYCESLASDPDDSEIDEVIFNTISNNTAGQCAVYTDFTNIETDVCRGEPYTLSLTLGTCGGSYDKGAKVFVDWNYDGNFYDPEEAVLTFGPTELTHTFTGEITIPTDVPFGPKRMRIVCQETTSPSFISACGVYSWGETEDYTLNIGYCNENEVIFTVKDGERLYQNATITIGNTIKYTDMDGEAFYYFPDGEYAYEISAENFKKITGSVIVEKDTTIGISLTRLNEVTFDVKGDANPLANALVCIDGQERETESTGLATFYLDDVSCNFTIHAEGYPDYTESVNITKDTTIRVIMTAVIKNIFSSGIKLYPNPVKYILYIELPENLKAKETMMIIMDFSGRAIITRKLDSKESHINLSGQQPGIYFILLQTGGEEYGAKLIIQ